MKKQKIIVLSVLGTLFVLSVSLFALEKLNVIHVFSKNTSQLSAEEQKIAATQKAAVNNAARTQKTTSSGTDASDTGSQDGNPEEAPKIPPSASNITLTASKTSGTTVTVYTQLKDYSDGACTLTITNGSATNTQTAQVMFQPQYAICAGFSVPIDKLGTGLWSIKLSVLSGGTTVDKTISYEVN